MFCIAASLTLWPDLSTVDVAMLLVVVANGALGSVE
jgi:hypothetical protein